MKRSTSISKIIRTNCTVVEAAADIHTIQFIFDHFPNQFLPVVKGLRFIGVILRDEFLEIYAPANDQGLTAADLVSKEMVKLSPENSLDEAKEVFDSKVFDMIPVADEDGDLMGIILREDVELQLAKKAGFPNPIGSFIKAFA